MGGKLLFNSYYYVSKYKFSNVPIESGHRKSPLINIIKAKINMTGPISVHDYMKEVLTNSVSGYYMTKDVFGKSGDFITSPEISQIFGEMMAVWTINEWQKLGAPKPFQLIELGPGRGTMMKDILRVLNRFKIQSSDLSIHLVEISRELSKIQSMNLCKTTEECTSDSPHYRRGLTQNKTQVFWHSSIQSIPQCFSCILAHEFFDALPVHILKKSEKKGWLEVLVDIDDTSCNRLKFVLSSTPTPASVYSKYSNRRDYFEISPQSGVIMEHISTRLEESGGFALVIDYGHDGTKTDTFRGFRKHKVVSPLEDPGGSDLTADVDFSFLKQIAQEKLIAFGPVTQQEFLKQLHIDVRLQMLLKNCKTEEAKQEILSGYRMIMDNDKMGECFKVAAFFPAILKEYLQQFPVVGFS